MEEFEVMSRCWWTVFSLFYNGEDDSWRVDMVILSKEELEEGKWRYAAEKGAEYVANAGR